MKREHEQLNRSKLYRLPAELVDGYRLYATKGKECLIGRPLRTGRVSLFWYEYKNGRKNIVRTGRVLYPETDMQVKNLNESTISEVRLHKVRQTDASRIRLADFVVDVASGKKQTSRNAANALALHLNEYSKGACLSEVDRTFVLGFSKYLKEDAKALSYKSKETAPHIRSNTQSSLLTQLSIALSEAVRRELIEENPIGKLSIKEKPKRELYNRTYLTKEEVRLLEGTPFPTKSKKYGTNVADAFLFSCYVGLRYSDVSKVTGSSIGCDDNGTYIKFTATKTSNEQVLYVPKIALRFIRPNLKSTDKLFALPHNVVCNAELRRWAHAAGIKEADRITFHMSRHTAATMYLNAGASLETVAFQLGHKSTKVTQIYAEIMNGTQKAATDKLDKFFDE